MHDTMRVELMTTKCVLLLKGLTTDIAPAEVSAPSWQSLAPEARLKQGSGIVEDLVCQDVEECHLE